MAQQPTAIPPGDPPSSTSLVVLATHEGTGAFRALARDGRGPQELAQLPGSLRPLLRRPPADPDLAESLGLSRTFLLEGLDPAALEGVSSQLMTSGLCESVSLDRIGRATDNGDGRPGIPSDEYFHLQYALRNTGQRIGGQDGTPGADLRVLEAWAISYGSPDVVVAVFDAGISESHPDLAPKLIDGWNFVDDSGDTDDHLTSHGTHVAGIIGALTGNREGVAGIARRCSLMPVVVLNRYGFGSESALAEALVWAADQGVPVASVSLGFNPPDGGADDLMLHGAVQYATGRGMLICASSGNVPSDRIGAPARYPEAIAVGATDNRDQLWSGTSTGPEMSVTAPGFQIVSTWDSTWQGAGEDTYDFKTGTSQACPHVAGIAALVYSINPRLTPLQIREIIEQTSVDLGFLGWDPSFGYGRVDAGAAARAALASRGRDPQNHTYTCIGDFNGDGIIDTRDFIEYLDAFRRQSRRANIAEPFDVWDTRDLLAFLEAWATACE